MKRKELIKGLEDIKEYFEEKVAYYGKDSEWSNDVIFIQKAIGLAKGTTKDVEIRNRLRSLEKRIKALQICISLLAVNITIALITITFIVARK